MKLEGLENGRDWEKHDCLWYRKPAPNSLYEGFPLVGGAEHRGGCFLFGVTENPVARRKSLRIREIHNVIQEPGSSRLPSQLGGFVCKRSPRCCPVAAEVPDVTSSRDYIQGKNRERLFLSLSSSTLFLNATVPTKVLSCFLGQAWFMFVLLAPVTAEEMALPELTELNQDGHDPSDERIVEQN